MLNFVQNYLLFKKSSYEFSIGVNSAILLTFIKLPFVFKTFVLSIFEWPLKTGFTVHFLFTCQLFFIKISAPKGL